MELNDEFVGAVRELGKIEILSSKDREYSTAMLHNLPRPDEPGFPTLKLESLDGLVETEEDNHVPHGIVQNFWRPVAEPLVGLECVCKEEEPIIREDKGDFIWRPTKQS